MAAPAPVWLATDMTPWPAGVQHQSCSAALEQSGALLEVGPQHGAPWGEHPGQPDSTELNQLVDGELQGKTLLVVLSGAAGRRRVLQRLLATGVRVLCYNTDINWASAYLAHDQWILGPLDDHQEAVARLHAWLARQPLGLHTVHGVLCYDEYGMQLAAVLAQSLGLPFMCPTVVDSMRNKYLFRVACQQAGVAVPRFLHVRGPLQPEDEQRIQQAGIRFPAVVKPGACAGSFAVLRVNSMAELRASVQSFYDGLPAYLASVGLGPTCACAMGGMVVEELILGQEVDIDCVVVRGQLLFACVSDNHPPLASSPGSASFVERGGRCPSSLPHMEQAALLHLASRTVGLWGPELSGVFHLEAFSTPQGPMPIELNGRIGGAETWTSVRSAWGVDLAHQAARIALGYAPLLPTLLQPPSQAVALQAGSGVAPAPGPAVHRLSTSLLLQQQRLLQGLASHMSAGSDRSSGDHLDPMLPSSFSSMASMQLSASHAPYGGSGSGSSMAAAGEEERRAEVRVGAHHRLAQQSSGRQGDGGGSQAAAGCTAAGMAGPAEEPLRCCLGSDSEGGEDDEDELLASSVHSGSNGTVAACSKLSLDAPDEVMQCCSVPAPPGDQGSGAQALEVPNPSMPPCAPPGALVAAANRGAGAGRAALWAAPAVHLVHPCKHVHSVNFVPEWEGEGVVEQLHVEPHVTRDPAYVDMHMYCGPGALVRLPPLGFSALGWMVVSGRDPQHAQHNMGTLLQGVHIQLRKPQ